MSQSGVSVRMVSHKCGKYESEWSKCEKKRVHVNHNITPLLILKFLLKILKVSAWFFGHVRVGNVVIVKGRVMVNFFD